MEIKSYYELPDKAYWLEQIRKSDWRAGQYLHKLLENNRLREMCGETTKVFLLVNGQELVSFCTLAEQDEICDETYGPWIGFVYTFPQYRGKRCAGKLLEYAYVIAKENGAKSIFISTNEIGLYEKYSYAFFKAMKNIGDEDCRVYKIDIM